MEDAQDHDATAVIAILEHVGGAEHFQDNLPVLLTSRERSAKFRVSGKKLRSGDDLSSDDRRKFGRLVAKKRRESIEVGQCIVRPLEVY